MIRGELEIASEWKARGSRIMFGIESRCRVTYSAKEGKFERTFGSMKTRSFFYAMANL